MTEPKKSANGWEIAKEEGKTVIVRIIGPMVAVYYPYRKGGDLYVAGPDETFFCCQCEGTFPKSEFLEHVTSHNKAKRKFPNFIIDPNLIEPSDSEKSGKVSV